MEDANLSQDEVAAELRKAKALKQLAGSAGEVQAVSLYQSVIRTLEIEQQRRFEGGDVGAA